jgi:hypothetical protein
MFFECYACYTFDKLWAREVLFYRKGSMSIIRRQIRNMAVGAVSYVVIRLLVLLIPPQHPPLAAHNHDDRRANKPKT